MLISANRKCYSLGSLKLLLAMALLTWSGVFSFSSSARLSLVGSSRVRGYQRHNTLPYDPFSVNSLFRQGRGLIPFQSLGNTALSTSTVSVDSHLCTCHQHGETTNGLRANVVISGLFWLMSMLPPFLPHSGKWQSFKYAGLVSVAFGLPPVVQRARETLRQRRGIDANCMMLTAALGALALREFGEAASVAFLFSVGHYLESRTTSTANRALMEIINLRQEQASLIDPVSKEVSVVPAERVLAGSLISVRVGERIGVDGTVLEGASTVDQSSLTGESIPVGKAVGDTVLGGSINSGPSVLVVKAMKDANDSAISKLIRLVEEAQARRSPKEKMIDRFSKIYTPITLALAGIMSTVPWLFGKELGRRWTLNGLIFVLLACPCALLISTPVTYTSGLAAMARHGVVVKGGETLETLGKVDTVLLDKTVSIFWFTTI